jgi:hypothetical protein
VGTTYSITCLHYAIRPTYSAGSQDHPRRWKRPTALPNGHARYSRGSRRRLAGRSGGEPLEAATTRPQLCLTPPCLLSFSQVPLLQLPPLQRASLTEWRKFKCESCQREFTGDHQWQAHIASKAHKRRVTALARVANRGPLHPEHARKLSTREKQQEKQQDHDEAKQQTS